MVYIYILALEGGFFYVGSAANTNIRQRLSIYFHRDHPSLPRWVRKHKFSRVVAVIKSQHQEDENKWVKIMMKYFSEDKVRGGSYSQSADCLDKPSSYFLELQRKHDSKCCLACGQPGCFILTCPQRFVFFAQKNQIIRNKLFENELLRRLKKEKNNQLKEIPVYTTSERVVFSQGDKGIAELIQYCQSSANQSSIDDQQLGQKQKRDKEVMTKSVKVQTEDAQVFHDIMPAIYVPPLPEAFLGVFGSRRQEAEADLPLDSEESFYSIVDHEDFAYDFAFRQIPQSPKTKGIFKADKKKSIKLN